MILDNLSRQFVRFIAVGSMNFLISTSILNLMARASGVYKGPRMLLYSAVAFTITVTFSYFCNRSWTFQSSGGPAVRFPVFVALTLVGLGLGSVVVFTVTTYVPAPRGVGAAAWLNFANMSAAGIGLLWNFTAYRQIVFREPQGEEERAGASA